MTPEERNRRIASLILRLAEFFPHQCEERQKTLYYEKLIACGRSIEAIEEAIERVINTRKQKSFPPWADIDERLADVAKASRSFEPLDHSKLPRFLSTTVEGIAANLAMFREGREADMPASKADPNHRDFSRIREQPWFKPLTQAEIDELERLRARDRQAESRGTVPPNEEDEVPF